MALNKQLLLKGLNRLQSDPPKSQAEAALRWASLYHNYAQGAQAGPVLPTALSSVVIQSQLQVVPYGTFYTKIEQAMISYWLSAVWLGPSFSGVTTQAAGAGGMLTSFAPTIFKTADPSTAASLLADALEFYTKTVIVVTTNIATGVTAPFTLL